MTTTLHIRWALRRDLDEMERLDREAGGSLGAADFLEWLRKRNCIGMVAERSGYSGGEPGSLAGLMVYELCKRQVKCLRFVAEDGHAGHTLYGKLLFKLASHRRPLLTYPVLPAWKTADVRNLARLRPCPLPILADALQEAGADEWITDALRYDGYREVTGAPATTFRAIRHGLLSA